MSKQDRVFTRTADALERKYEFSLLGKGGGGDSAKVSQLEQTLSQYMVTTNGEIEEINEKLDGVVDYSGAIDDLTNNKVDKIIEYYGDMNNLVTSGFYRVGTNANLPSGYEYGQVIVSRGSDTATQIACSYHLGTIVTRSCNSPDVNPNWTEWIEYATKKDLEELETGGGLEVSYDAENEAITLLPSSTSASSWNPLTEKTGETGTITLPTVFEELRVVIGTESYMYTFNILAVDLTDEPTLYREGFYLNSTAYGDAYISITKTQITAWAVRRENVAKEVTVKVYFK